MNTVETMTIEEAKALKATAETEILEIIKTLEATIGEYVINVGFTRDYTGDPAGIRTNGVSLSVMI